MIKLIKSNYIFLINLIVVAFLVSLPYILFQGKLYISGDDTRLYYAYPIEYFKEFTFSSWHHFSSLGAYGPTQFMIPFLLIWSLLDLIIPSKIALSYLGFSLPFILGYLFSQLFLKEIVFKKKISLEIVCGSIFYIFSPILLTNQYFIFLSTIWIVALLPLISFLFVRYIHTGKFIYVLISIIASVIFSISLFSIPWVLGYFLPLAVGVLIVFALFKLYRSVYFKRTIIFILLICLAQSFWLLSFLMTYIGGSEVNFGSKVFSKSVSDTFTPTVLSTATGNVIYPLLNLFHRQIPLDFNWALKDIFINFYDKIFYLNLLFPALILYSLSFGKKYLSRKNKQSLSIFLIAFIFALFMFTVNIGPLRELFLYLGNIPGFVMFRNFYDKLAFPYVFFFSVLITYSLILLKNMNKLVYYSSLFLVLLLVLLNFSQVGKIVNAPLWQTQDIGRNVEIPAEYIDFMNDVKNQVSTSENILTVPFGTALYSVIKDTDSDSVYTGTSPVKLFSGVNDLSGYLSFYFSDAKGIIENMLLDRNYTGLSELMNVYNINYIFYNKNIPEKVLNSWIFDRRMNEAQDQIFFESLVEEKPVLTSSNGSYLLYKVKRPNVLITSDNLYFKKINETKFRIYIRNISKRQALNFFDSYHYGWKIFLEKDPDMEWCTDIVNTLSSSSECKEDLELFNLEDISYSLKQEAFLKSHAPHTEYLVNSWIVDKDEITKYDERYFELNDDGSVNIELVLYFVPQNYFYLGTLVSLVTIVGSLIYIIVLYAKK